MRAVFRIIFHPVLWTAIGLALLSVLIWLFSPLLSFGEATPFVGETARIVLIGAIWTLWLLRLLWKRIAAIRANRVFVTELSQPETAAATGADGLAEVGERFKKVLEQMKRSKLGGRKFLRDMPWYVIIGPPGTGKTTALQQSGLHFPIDLSDDLKGIGGTRNCDWFFTEDAILIDTAGRYVEQGSDPEADAAEWLGFLDLLVKHRGRRALNGVIVTLSVQELAADEGAVRVHGREIRHRLTELQERLRIRLPVYLMITKMDLLPGFEETFADLGTRAREQVWGATLPAEARVDGALVERELTALRGRLEERMVDRLAEERPVSEHGAIFRFPSEVERLTPSLKALVDATFGESSYEETPWLRGFYFTSATQDGTAIDRLVQSMAQGFGLYTPRQQPRRHVEARSFFLRELMTDVIFREAGLGTFDPRAEDRRRWAWMGGVAAVALVTVVMASLFAFSYQRWNGNLRAQADSFTDLDARLETAANRTPATQPLDLDVGLDAATVTLGAAIEAPGSALSLAGPEARAELEQAQRLAYEHVLSNILEPRMVALLEATIQQHLRDPEFLLGALKSYQMVTGLAPLDSVFLADWWQTVLPKYAPITVFPDDAAAIHQVAAIERLAGDEDKIAPDEALVASARRTICDVPLSTRAYHDLLSKPEVAALPDWRPAEHAGPNGTSVFTRLSDKTLRIGLPGAYTHDGFDTVVLPLVSEVAAEAVLDRTVFAGSCAESADATTATLENDILKLYYDDYISQWDAMLRDLRLQPIEDLDLALGNLRDLSSDDSAMSRLLTSVVNETWLTKPPEEGAGGGGVPASKVTKLLPGKLKKVVKLARKGAAATAGGESAAPPEPGSPVAEHFKPLRAMTEEVDGAPPLIGGVTAVLTQLSNELLRLRAGSSSELAEGARLTELTGAVRIEAARLPDPVDDWLLALAGELGAVTRGEIIDELDARLASDVLRLCRAATNERFPFEPGQRIDVNIADFARLFGPGGLFDTYTEEALSDYIDRTSQPWSWRADYGLSPELLQPFQTAAALKDALFLSGPEPSLRFTLVPQDIRGGASSVTLNVDGDVLAYFNGPPTPKALSWPGPNGAQIINLSFATPSGTSVSKSEIGAWAPLRLFRTGRLRATDRPDVYRLSLAHGGFAADFDLIADSVENPFDLTMFSGFRCPDGFR